MMSHHTASPSISQGLQGPNVPLGRASKMELVWDQHHFLARTRADGLMMVHRGSRPIWKEGQGRSKLKPTDTPPLSRLAVPFRTKVMWKRDVFPGPMYPSILKPINSKLLLELRMAEIPNGVSATPNASAWVHNVSLNCGRVLAPGHQ